MGAKRALIVDDSKSARAFLSRILEKYEIDVDSAESAEQAIEYLGHHRPDVIFMDHMMPGMDGFQAVQVIKNNPRTAMIPIMMYTSQEGELYLGQARALGAVGVLPKQIKPADVSKVLYQLHLVPDRRSSEPSAFRPVVVGNNSEGGEAEAQASSSGARTLTDATLREQFAELRRALLASLDSQTDRILADVRLMIQDLRPSPEESPPPAPRTRPWGWITAAIAGAVAIASTALLWQHSAQQRTLLEELQRIRAQIAAAETAQGSAERSADAAPEPESDNPPVAADPAANLAGAAGAAAAATPVASAGQAPAASTASTREVKPIIETVPYGAEPLAGPRLEVMRQLLTRLAAERYQGTVEVKVFPGRFCLIGNSTEGFSLPPEETLYSKCDVVGSPPEESFSAARIPIGFANLVGAFRNSTRGTADVQVSAGDASVTVAPYPQVSDSLTAGEWNRAGSANNRIEIRVR